MGCALAGTVIHSCLCDTKALFVSGFHYRLAHPHVHIICDTLTCDGKLVTLCRVDEAVSTIDNIDEYRLEQPSPGVYMLYLVTPRKDKDVITKEAKDVLRNIYGKAADISVVFEEALSPEDSGKYCLAKPLFSLDIENYLDTRNI